MKNLCRILLAASLFVVASCAKDHYLSSTEKKEFDELANPSIRGIVFVKDKEIYYSLSVKYPAIQVTSDGKDKNEPRISPDGKRIAYLDQGFHPVIIDRMTGEEIASYPNLSANRNYDWNPAPTGQSSDGLYMLNVDKILFSGTELENPSLTFAGNLWHSACFDINGNFFFMITENADPNKVVKLYRWEKTTGKISRMTLEKPITKPEVTTVQASQNGDIILKTNFNGATGYDTYYVYPTGTLKHTLKVSQAGMLDVRYNGKLKQSLIFGPNPKKLNTEMQVKNHAGYARSVDRSIDTTAVPLSIKYFEWK